jgi:hypothetical protein
MKRNIVVLGILSVALAACGSESQPEANVSPNPTATVAKASKAGDPMAGMARAVGNGKPGASVDIKYEFQAKPEVGKPVQLDIALIPSSGVSAMDVVVAGMEGVSLTGTLTQTFTDVKAGEPYKHQLTVLPQTTGVFYVTVTATTHIGSATMGRTFNIPFVVGTVLPQEKPAAPQKDATGQPIQPMPATETASAG